MVKVVVNKGRKVWDRENHREAREGETVEVKPVEATILKYRGHASDVSAAPIDATPIPSAPPTPPPVAETPSAVEALSTETASQLVEVPIFPSEDSPLRGRYRRRDLRSEN